MDEQGRRVVGSLAGSIKTLADAFNVMGRRGHGAIALAFAARIEDELQRCLIVSFRELSKHMRQRLFGTYGPLSTFASLIDVTYAMQIIDDDVYNELRKVKTIRNKFAHSGALISFDVEPIASLTDSLRAPMNPRGERLQRYTDSITFINDALERYLVSKGVTENISQRNLPSTSPPEIASAPASEPPT